MTFPKIRPSLFTASALALALIVADASAATYAVDSLGTFQSRINGAVAGDTITLKDGVYLTATAIEVACTGAPGRPITITATTIGDVEIDGAAGFAVKAPAAYIVIEGFKLKHTAGQNTIAAGATHVRFTRNIFNCSGAGAELDVAGDDAEVDHNEFRDKSTVGNMVSVTGTAPQVARRLWLHHNYFHDYANAHANGAETVRFGRSFLSMSRGDGVIEYNLFVRCTGENEIITNKSCGNTYRYNTFLDSPGGELSERHGNDCLIYGNYFRNTQGIRICGDRHQVFSNYLEGNSIAITMCNGDGEVADGAKLTCHDRPDNCVISFNTLVNNRINFQMNGRAKGLGATNTRFANNIIQGGGKAAEISSTAPYPGGSWEGNLLWQTAGAGDLPASGFVTADPRLAPDANGILHLQAGSPAIGSAVGQYPLVTVDFDGQARHGPRDKGADEFLPGVPTSAHLLTPDDVGPTSGLGKADRAKNFPAASRDPDGRMDVVKEFGPGVGGTHIMFPDGWLHSLSRFAVDRYKLGPTS